MAKIRLNIELTDDGIPVRFTLRDRKFAVRALLDRWQGTGHAYFKLVADDGNLYVIRHDLEENEWEMVLMEALPHGAGR